MESWALDEFLEEIGEICEKYNIEIEHEDIGGSFILKKGFDGNRWFNQAGVVGFEDRLKRYGEIDS